MNLELNVVRFENEDVIATSCGGGVWSTKSYMANNLRNALIVEAGTHDNGKLFAAYSGTGDVFDGEDGYNKLDGDVVPEKYGVIFTAGEFYHYDINSLFSNDWNANTFQTCTDPSHHYIPQK